MTHASSGIVAGLGRTSRSLLLIAPLLAACYTYTPIETAELQPRMSLRARVSSAAGQRIAPLLGVSDARLLTGTLIGSERDTMIVEVPTTARADAGSVTQVLHQRVSIPRGDVLALESRKLDRFRTTALVGAAAAILVSGVIKGLKEGRGSENLPPGGGTDALVPLFRIYR